MDTQTRIEKIIHAFYYEHHDKERFKNDLIEEFTSGISRETDLTKLKINLTLNREIESMVELANDYFKKSEAGNKSYLTMERLIIAEIRGLERAAKLVNQVLEGGVSS